MKYEILGSVIGLLLANILVWFVYLQYIDNFIIITLVTFTTSFTLTYGCMKIGCYIDKHRRDKK